MRILLVLGTTADTGGPTTYARELQPLLAARGHHTALVSYPSWMWRLPFGIRHLLFALYLWPQASRADVMLGFDTMTVGAPLWLVSYIPGTPYAIRVGGDFVWEQFVESTGRLVPLSKFYTTSGIPLKQRLEIWLTGLIARRASVLMFNSGWLRDIWQRQYRVAASKAHVVENVYPARRSGEASQKKVFVAAGRPIKLKQEALLRGVFDELRKKYPDLELDTTSLPPAEHHARVARSYAVVLPSVSDVSPNGIIDAVVYGKPFVCTADTGIRERLEGTGLFVDTSDASGLTRAIESLLDAATYAATEARVKTFTFVRTWDDVANDVEQALTRV